MNQQKYRIRRALLKACARFEMPQTLNIIILDDGVQLERAEGSVLAREWDALTEEKYLFEVRGYPEYRSLAPAVRAKLEAGISLLDDPFLAGPSAFGR